MSKQIYFTQFSTQFKWSTQLNVKILLFQAIQFSTSTQFSSVWPRDRILSGAYHSEPEWIWEWWQWKGALHSTNLQHYWNLTIRLFSVISGTLVADRSYPSTEKQSVYSIDPANTIFDKKYLLKRTFIIVSFQEVSCINYVIEDKIICWNWYIYIYIYIYMQNIDDIVFYVYE